VLRGERRLRAASLSKKTEKTAALFVPKKTWPFCQILSYYVKNLVDNDDNYYIIEE